MNARGLCDAVSGALDGRGAPREPGGCEVAPSGEIASPRDPAAPQAVPNRVIDTERAGGTGNAGPKGARVVFEPVSVDEALDYVRGLSWRTVLPRGDRALVALAAEVERLRAVGATCADLLVERSERLAAIRAALPEIITCAITRGGYCCLNPYSAKPRCGKAAKLGEALGLVPKAEPLNPNEDGA